MSNKLKARAWCFTINNYTDDDVDKLLAADCTYMVFGFEEGENGTPHIQGYIHFENPRSQSGVKTILPRAHLEVARGSVEDNYKYCTKDGDFHEFGEKPKQGKRTDIIQIKDRIVNGDSMQDIMNDHPLEYVRYFKGLERIKNSLSNKRTNGREVIYVSPTDLDHDLDDAFYCNSPTSLNHYDNQSTLVLYSQKGFNTYDLELFIKGHPLYTANKVVNPKKLIIVKND